MGNVDKIFIIGDYSKGIDSGNIEVVLVGKELNLKYISELEEKVEKIISRKVNFYLTSKFTNKQHKIELYSKVS